MVAAWSIGKSQRGFVKKSDTPGPGSYYPFKHHNNTPNSWKIGTEKSRQKANQKNVPGPGQYEPGSSKKQTLRKFPEYIFGVKNYKQSFNDTPGPGQYEQFEDSVRKTQPLYTFGLKTGTNLDSKYGKYSPSPADYIIDRDKTLTQRPSSKIGYANRKNLYDTNDTPGVGNYQVSNDYKGYKYSFGKQSRIQSSKILRGEVPGPGAYDSRSQLNHTSKTMGMKLGENSASLKKLNQYKPGPQDYRVEVNIVKRGQSGVKIGREQRNKMGKEDTYKPGPNVYRPVSVDKKRSATYKIGTELRGKLKNRENPGPGTYESSSTIGTGKKYPMGQKFGQRDLMMQPGPADYQQDPEVIKQRPASCKIGSSRRGKYDGSENPGPGTYYMPKNEIGPHISFGKELRSGYQLYDTPGPGTYQLQPKFAEVPDYLLKTSKEFMV